MCIASPETLPDADLVTSLNCFLKGVFRETSDNDIQHDIAKMFSFLSARDTHLYSGKHPLAEVQQQGSGHGDFL